MEDKIVNRADERRRRETEANIAAILDGTVALLEHDPKPSFVDIARAAGVSRPTLYSHFPTRDDLVAAAVKRAIEATGRDIARARLEDGSADDALKRLVTTGWRGLSRQRTTFRLAMDLPAERRRQVHETALVPVRQLLLRGRREGVFRDDQPVEWMVSLLYALLHAAAEDVAAGRLVDVDVGETRVRIGYRRAAPPRAHMTVSPLIGPRDLVPEAAPPCEQSPARIARGARAARDACAAARRRRVVLSHRAIGRAASGAARGPLRRRHACSR